MVNRPGEGAHGAESQRSIALVLESELPVDRREIVDDFCKLMVARARLRVMIYGASTRANADDLADAMIDELKGSALPEEADEFLLAGLREDTGTFAFMHPRASSAA